MKNLLLLFVFVLGFSLASAQIPSSEVQIKTALLSATEDQRAGAQVYGYDAKGEFVILRKGTNELICLADDPKQVLQLV